MGESGRASRVCGSVAANLDDLEAVCRAHDRQADLVAEGIERAARTRRLPRSKLGADELDGDADAAHAHERFRGGAEADGLAVASHAAVPNERVPGCHTKGDLRRS